MPIPSGFKTKEEWNNYQKEYRANKTAKEKAADEQLKNYKQAELQSQKDCLAVLNASTTYASDSLNKAWINSSKAVGAEFEKLMDLKTHNKAIFSIIDIVSNFHLKTMDFLGSSSQEKQAWINTAENLKELIRTDQVIVFSLGKEDEKTKIKMLEEKKENE